MGLVLTAGQGIAETCGQLLVSPTLAATASRPADPYGLLGGETSPARGLPIARGSRDEYERSWQQAGLPYALLDHYVSNARCYESEMRLLQCVAAINALLDFLPESGRLLPRNSPALSAHFGPKLHDFGVASVQALREPNTRDPAQLMELNKRLRDQIQRAWQAHAARGERVDFEAILRWARLAVVTPQTESLVTATAINAALGVADAHARIMPEALLRSEQSSDVADRLVGIGIILSQQNEEMVVQSVIEGGPAEQAGLEPGDVVITVGNRPVSKDKLAEMAKLIRGEAGTYVDLKVRRGGAELAIRVQRRAVEVKNVSHKLYQHGTTKLGYLRLGSFMSHAAPDQIAEAIRQLEAQGAQGLVLDLRNNGGGELGVAVKIAGHFLGPDKPVVISRSLYPQAIPDRGYKTSGPQLTELPLLVLVNARSASASELLSGALQDFGRALVVGDRTFGKGTVQSAMQLAGEHAVLAKFPVVLFETIARFHLPSGRTNQLVGITPDFPVHHSPTPQPQELVQEREEDIYPNALSALGEPYRQPRPQLVSWINACVARKGLAKGIYTSRRKTSMPLDYQLLVSADIMTCLREAIAQIEARRLASAPPPAASFR